MNLKANYGISLEDYAEMSSAQGGVCAACGCAETGKNQYGPVPLAVDHCHATGKIRGLLCMRCNRALGLLADDPIRVENLLTYRNLHR